MSIKFDLAYSCQTYLMQAMLTGADAVAWYTVIFTDLMVKVEEQI